MNPNYRLHLFKKSLGLTNEVMANELGVETSTYTKYEKEASSIPRYAIIILELKFRLNRQWLLTGDGEMMIPEKEMEEKRLMMAAEAAERYGKHKLREIATDLEQLSKRLRSEIEQKNTE